MKYYHQDIRIVNLLSVLALLYIIAITIAMHSRHVQNTVTRTMELSRKECLWYVPPAGIYLANHTTVDFISV